MPPARELPPAPAAPYPHTGEAVAPPCPEGFEERPEVTAPDEGIHVRLDIEPAQAAAGEVPDLHIVNSGRNESRP